MFFCCWSLPFDLFSSCLSERCRIHGLVAMGTWWWNLGLCSVFWIRCYSGSDESLRQQYVFKTWPFLIQYIIYLNSSLFQCALLPSAFLTRVQCFISLGSEVCLINLILMTQEPFINVEAIGWSPASRGNVCLRPTDGRGFLWVSVRLAYHKYRTSERWKYITHESRSSMFDAGE